MFAIEARGLHKIYSGVLGRPGQRALTGVDLAVPAGAAFGLIGQNGAGKTTFIKILLGVVRPSEGTVRILDGHPEDPKVRARTGYLPERLHLPDAWRPRAFLESVARLKNVRLSRSRLDELLERVGLAADADRRIRGFSKGMRQRLGLAAALLGQPELLVLDEPTDGIDPIGRVEIRRILQGELGRGATIFLNSHLLAETERVCQRIGILAHGRLLREGPLEDLRRAGRSWRVRFADGADAGELAAIGFTPGARSGTWHYAADDAEALNAAIDRARQSGALLVSLEPEERDLEQVLAATLGVAA
ncbi:MAG TPA: ABC transporter ATP-binding protein [Myxococcaceae bacterium]|nr:ABC transporter ATP-binding protein [Myxococcaceae bacterium]